MPRSTHKPSSGPVTGPVKVTQVKLAVKHSKKDEKEIQEIQAPLLAKKAKRAQALQAAQDQVEQVLEQTTKKKKKKGGKGKKDRIDKKLSRTQALRQYVSTLNRRLRYLKPVPTNVKMAPTSLLINAHQQEYNTGVMGLAPFRRSLHSRRDEIVSDGTEVDPDFMKRPRYPVDPQTGKVNRKAKPVGYSHGFNISANAQRMLSNAVQQMVQHIVWRAAVGSSSRAEHTESAALKRSGRSLSLSLNDLKWAAYMFDEGPTLFDRQLAYRLSQKEEQERKTRLSKFRALNQRFKDKSDEELQAILDSPLVRRPTEEELHRAEELETIDEEEMGAEDADDADDADADDA